MLTLKGRTCYFAGATGNIGRGAVKAMAESGMNVVMATHDPARAGDIISEMKDLPGTVIAVSNEKPLPELLEEIEKQYGSVDVYLNTTGSLSVPLPFEDISREILVKKLNHHITDPFLELQTFLPYLKKSSHPRIILCASAGAENGLPEENIADSIARGGVITMTMCLARELLPYGITVNCIARSGMINDHDDHKDTTLDASAILPLIPVQRNGTAEEFGALVSYLASEESAFMTGQVLNLSGGLVIGR